MHSALRRTAKTTRDAVHKRLRTQDKFVGITSCPLREIAPPNTLLVVSLWLFFLKFLGSLFEAGPAQGMVCGGMVRCASPPFSVTATSVRYFQTKILARAMEPTDGWRHPQMTGGGESSEMISRAPALPYLRRPAGVAIVYLIARRGQVSAKVVARNC